MPEPPQLAPLDVEEQRLYSEPLLDGRAPHPTEEAHFSHLYPGSRSFGHDPKFMAIVPSLLKNQLVSLNEEDSLEAVKLWSRAESRWNQSS
ncbi:hypothetical protein CHARACLAT_019975 [Characodon lateralis]|uniref:Uncharacterized protein n=1 Tax=Characodon lateralis TaxID=208331 RepID=A0ABU7DC29_9TELE|nr:hypothetical protein [Characodon lateralis]